MSRNLTAAAGMLLAAATLAAPAAAQDAVAGRRVAARTCAACHGLNGIATLPEAANLAGQDATYLARQLEAFREGSRVNEQMSVVAKTLTDAQISDVTGFYSAIQVEVVKVPGEP